MPDCLNCTVECQLCEYCVEGIEEQPVSSKSYQELLEELDIQIEEIEQMNYIL